MRRLLSAAVGAALAGTLVLVAAGPARAGTVTQHPRGQHHPGAAITAMADQTPSTARGAGDTAVLAEAVAVPGTASWWSLTDRAAIVSSHTACSSAARGPPGQAA